jgi:hypothetical protein
MNKQVGLSTSKLSLDSAADPARGFLHRLEIADLLLWYPYGGCANMPKHASVPRAGWRP